MYNFDDIGLVFEYLFPKFHIILEVALVLLVLWLLLKKSSDPKYDKNLTTEEEEQRISDWSPDPLIPTFDLSPRVSKPYLVDGKIGKFINVDGSRCLNLATHNYLGLAENPSIQSAAIASVQKYGVGSCGPRGFYGTFDVHLQLEEKLATFMGMEEAVVYSYGFSTVASAIPAYAKRGDIIFADENVNFAVQKGLDASRSLIKYFKHNDMGHLEEILHEQDSIDKKNKRKTAKTRKFLVVEGIYMNSGDICPLPDLLQLREKFQLRIFIDESISFGTLGETGRGVTEHFNVPVKEVDLIMGSLEWSVASIGGFCVGSSFIVEHQRLSGLGYCFSASLPPLLTSAAIEALSEIESNPSIIADLRKNCLFCHDLLVSENISTLFDISGHPESPVKHLYLKNNITVKETSGILDTIIATCISNGYAFTTAAYLRTEKHLIRESIRITLNARLTTDEIKQSVAALHKAAEEILSA